jgi:hypothetical protein
VLTRTAASTYLASAGALALAALLAFPHVEATSAADGAVLAVGPGPVLRSFPSASRRLELRIVPNRASAWNTLELKITKKGVLQRGAHVTAAMTMRAMQMGTQTFRLNESPGGTYTYLGPALVMAGLWDIQLVVTSSRGTPFTVRVRDRVGT